MAAHWFRAASPQLRAPTRRKSGCHLRLAQIAALWEMANRRRERNKQSDAAGYRQQMCFGSAACEA